VTSSSSRERGVRLIAEGLKTLADGCDALAEAGVDAPGADREVLAILDRIETDGLKLLEAVRRMTAS